MRFIRLCWSLAIALATFFPCALQAAGADGSGAEPASGSADTKNFGTYKPGAGFKVAEAEQGSLNIKVFTYLRYINQNHLDPTYVNEFGDTVDLHRRQDIQLQKVNIQFLGWIMSPKLRYLFYVWTSNTSQGLGGQVVVGGNINYTVNRHLTAGGGIGSLPGVRSTEGNFPYWLTVDNRLIADEFFRPSYTTGIWAKGEIIDRMSYNVMLGNNLSQVGIDAGQLDSKLRTVASDVVWLPTTGEFGSSGGFGDFADHEEVATRVGGHYTYSDENYQGQPTTQTFENVQIRISNGGIIFQPDLFGPGIWVQDAVYQMACIDAGVKYRGFSLEAEQYWRLINDLRGPNTAGLPELNDHGFQLQASAMALPKSLQVYASASKVFGEYGNPSDVRVGANWYPWENEVVRWNAEYLHLDESPVGNSSLPYIVGGNGYVLYTSFQVNF